jgi:hypothetical protein
MFAIMNAMLEINFKSLFTPRKLWLPPFFLCIHYFRLVVQRSHVSSLLNKANA